MDYNIFFIKKSSILSWEKCHETGCLRIPPHWNFRRGSKRKIYHFLMNSEGDLAPTYFFLRYSTRTKKKKSKKWDVIPYHSTLACLQGKEKYWQEKPRQENGVITYVGRMVGKETCKSEILDSEFSREVKRSFEIKNILRRMVVRNGVNKNIYI